MATAPTRILITGATGFVGQHLLRRLSETHASAERIALTRHADRVPAALRELATWRELDLASDPLPDDLLAGVDALVHLATPPARDASMADSVRLNVDATARLYEQAARHDVAHVVHVSTTSIYQPVQDADAMLDEDAERVSPPAHPYALTKRWGEEVAATYREGDGGIGQITVLRPSHVYGTGQRTDGLLAEMADTIVAGGQIYLGGQEGHRMTPVHVDDVVDALVWALDHPSNDTLNVAGPEHLTSAELARRVAEHFDTVLAFVDRPEETTVSVAIDSSRLDQRCPERNRTPLADGLERTWPGGELE